LFDRPELEISAYGYFLSSRCSGKENSYCRLVLLGVPSEVMIFWVILIHGLLELFEDGSHVVNVGLSWGQAIRNRPARLPSR
jgi:hypothetical protein